MGEFRISDNGVTILHELLEARFLPGLQFTRNIGNLHQPERDEIRDALDCGGLPLQCIGWTWGIETGQISLSAAVESPPQGQNVDLALFAQALTEVEQIAGLEWSLPLSPEALAEVPDAGAPGVMQPFPGQRVHLIARTPWLALAANGDVARDCARVSLRPALSTTEGALGEPWLRLSEAWIAVLKAEPPRILRLLAMLGERRVRLVQRSLLDRSHRLSLDQVQLINEHLEAMRDLHSIFATAVLECDKLPDAVTTRAFVEDGLRELNSALAEGATPAMSSGTIFIAYSHADDGHRRQIEQHLSPLQRTRKLAIFSDRRIHAGVEWEREIGHRLAHADVVLLLISSDFIASDYCFVNELTVAMRRHDEGAAVVIPVFLRACHWKGLPFAKLQGVPKDANPIEELASRDAGYEQVAKAVEQALNDLAGRGRRTPAAREEERVSANTEANPVQPGFVDDPAAESLWGVLERSRWQQAPGDYALGDVVSFLSTISGLKIWIDTSSLGGTHDVSSRVVRMPAAGITLATILTYITAQVEGARWDVVDGSIWITTTEALIAVAYQAVYVVSDLTQSPGLAGPGLSAAEIADALIGDMNFDDWRHNGGALSSFRIVRDAIVVTTTARGHRAIRNALLQLRGHRTV